MNLEQKDKLFNEIVDGIRFEVDDQGSWVIDDSSIRGLVDNLDNLYDIDERPKSETEFSMPDYMSPGAARAIQALKIRSVK